MTPGGNYKSGKRSAAGFTLLEVLLAIGISAVVLTSVYSAFRVGWFSYKRLDSQSQILDSLRSSLNKLEKDLRNTFLFNGAAFKGAENEVSFITLIRVKDKEGFSYVEAARAIYKLEGANLMRAYLKNAEVLKQGAEPKFEPFLSDVSIFKFSYAKIDDSSGEPKLEWSGSFDAESEPEGSAGIPNAVRIELLLKPQGLPALSLKKSVFLPNGGAARP